jgi:cytochrome P450
MTIGYDPFSDAAMRDPYSLYSELRKEGGPHYIKKYDAWALARFEDVWNASLSHEKDVTFSEGQPLVNVLLGEPVPRAFPTMDGQEHRKWRTLLRTEYTPNSVQSHEQRFTDLAREILNPLLEKREFDVYSEYFNRLFAVNAGYNMGLSEEDSITWRSLIDETQHREIGQIGTVTDRNLKAGQQLMEYLFEHISNLRQHPELARGQTAIYLNAEVDGVKLDDKGLVDFLIIMLTVGSGTTPNVCSGAVYYLNRYPEQKAAVLKDLTLVGRVFSEAARYDQPTNILCRRAVNDFELGGKMIKAGQALLYIYASANRDADEFDDPDTFNIFRDYKRDLIFGIGGHKCLGMHLATMGGRIALTELLKAVGDYQILEDQCTRAYSEFLSGFNRVQLKF